MICLHPSSGNFSNMPLRWVRLAAQLKEQIARFLHTHNDDARASR
jgi:hypothetical protein